MRTASRLCELSWEGSNGNSSDDDVSLRVDHDELLIAGPSLGETIAVAGEHVLAVRRDDDRYRCGTDLYLGNLCAGRTS